MDVLGPHFTKESVSPPAQSLIQDSEWFALGPQEKLAWVKASRDPRIAEGQQSPLEKKILGSSGHALRAQLARARPSYETLTCGNLLGAGSALPGVNEEKSLLSVPARGIGLRAEGEVVRLRWRCAEQLHRRGPSRVWVSRESSFSAF
ncbi:uncharacterized protein LOC114228293 isoform X6 [Eptesicus fuscus]|uniref:uncharacterized protein LOC114228293 isoform X6 n=1 Tax=Eptesicus fuscus TaxID=29078 RepID=UPI002403D2A7|nr:uncharacterized protein LOC114228293 isoform X6 [Eptesicus fuscus]